MNIKFQLALDLNIPLAIMVTALSIAGEGGGKEVKQLEGNLVSNDNTTIILRKVAEKIVK